MPDVVKFPPPPTSNHKPDHAIFSPIKNVPSVGERGRAIIKIGVGKSEIDRENPCPKCGVDNGQTVRKTIGVIVFLWCICLFVATGGIGSIYPFCHDSCKDTEYICNKCQMVKRKVPANCC